MLCGLSSLAWACVRLKVTEGAYRITQLNLQYNSGRGESQLGLIWDRDGYTFSCVLPLGGRRTIYDLGIRVNSSRKRRIVRRKRPFFY